MHSHSWPVAPYWIAGISHHEKSCGPLSVENESESESWTRADSRVVEFGFHAEHAGKLLKGCKCWKGKVTTRFEDFLDGCV